MSDKTSQANSIGFLGMLTVVFTTLKLLDKIDWSWWWILSPLWLPFTVVFLIFLIIEFRK